MQRRKFLIGAGSLAAGASTVVGSGAFSAEESKRTFTVQTTHDANGITRLIGGDKWDESTHADAYTKYDHKGHLVCVIPHLNSGSQWYFKKLFKLGNAAKDGGTHKYWIENEFWNGFDEEDLYYHHPKKGKIPRVRWFAQGEHIKHEKLFQMPAPGPAEGHWMKGQWMSGKDKYVEIPRGKHCKVGLCIITKGLPQYVYDNRGWTVLTGAEVNAKAVDS